MQTLYPDIHPYTTHRLTVEAPHDLYIEECGEKNGIPILFVHGGPGAGCEEWHRRFFDPEVYRIILFDQRGCGRSTPHCHLENNTTDKLVADIEAIREYLNIKQWILFGGSWGSTLSLVYAQTHPERVKALILRGIFLCRPQEIQWFYQRGASEVFPDHWQKFIAPILTANSGDEQQTALDNILESYHKLLNSNNELQRMGAAKSWSIWEGSCSTIQPSKSVINHFSDTHTALSLAQIETHYFMHNSFLEENQILNNMDKLDNIPGIIVQGRYDMVCPMTSAWELNQNWPESRLEIIANAGHSAKEPGIVDALVQATIEYGKFFK